MGARADHEGCSIVKQLISDLQATSLFVPQKVLGKLFASNSKVEKCAISERLRGVITTRRYTNPHLPYLTLPKVGDVLTVYTRI